MITTDILNNIANYIFNIFGMYVPALFYLVTLGHLVYSIGEYKTVGKTDKIPPILMLLMFKLVLVGLIIYSIYSWHFSLGKLSIAMLLWGFLITFDCRHINNMLAHIDNFNGERSDFREYLNQKINEDILIDGTPFWYYFTKVFLVLMISLTLIYYYSVVCEDIILSDVCLPIYVYYDVRLLNYYFRYIKL